MCRVSVGEYDNSQKIIELLYIYVCDEKRKGQYTTSKDHKIVIELFDQHEHVLSHRSPRAGSLVTQELAEQYSNKMQKLKSLDAQLKAQFRKDIVSDLNDLARQCIDAKTLKKLPENTNYFQYITGYKESLINKRLDELLSTLPDQLFTMSVEYQTKTKELIINSLFYTQLDLQDDERFLNFLFEFFDKILSVFKETAMAEQENLKQAVLKNPSELTADNLKEEFLQIIDFSANSTALKIFRTNCHRYIAYLQKEGHLSELHDRNKGDLSKRLEYLKEYTSTVQLMFSKEIIDKKDIPVLRQIQESILKSHSKTESAQVIKELRAAKQAMESSIKQAKEAQEIALIKLFDGKEGDQLESNGLTKRQAFGLKLFKEAFKDKRILAGEQKEFAQKFLVSALGNAKLNKLLNEEDSTEKDLRDLTHRTKDLHIFLEAAEKLIVLNTKIKNNEPVLDEDKLSLREYGVLKNYMYMQPFMERLYKGPKLVQEYSPLSDIYNKIKQCSPILKTVEKLIEEEASQGIQSGDLLLNSIERAAEFSGKKLSARDKITLQMTKHMHTTKLVRKSEDAKTFSMSHVATKGSSTIGFDIKSYLYSDLYKINITPLINSELSDKLKAKYGNEYEKHINSMYRDIEAKIHENTSEKFKGVALRDDIEYQLSRLTEFFGYLGHNKLIPESLDKVHTDILNGAQEKNKMLCSEFAARTTAAAFVELNNKLKEELGITEDVIKIPFSERERFSKVHPDRLLQILQEAGCIQQTERTETEKKYLKFSDKVEASRVQKTESVRE